MAQDYAIQSIDMLDKEGTLETLVEQAAGVIAASHGKVMILQVMTLVGFTKEE
jgi:hypothetical protein